MSVVPGVLFSIVDVSDSGACALKCTCVAFFLGANNVHDACVDHNSIGTLCMVDSALLFIHN